MINFIPYTGDPFELYRNAVEAKKDKEGKESLTLIEKDVKAEYEKYNVAFTHKRVHSLLSLIHI